MHSYVLPYYYEYNSYNTSNNGVRRIILEIIFCLKLVTHFLQLCIISFYLKYCNGFTINDNGDIATVLNKNACSFILAGNNFQYLAFLRFKITCTSNYTKKCVEFQNQSFRWCTFSGFIRFYVKRNDNNTSFASLLHLDVRLRQNL